MEKYKIDFKDDIPKYIQIRNHLKNLIDENVIGDGERLASIRFLSKYLNVNTVTIINAYKGLKDEGYAFQKSGSGTYAKKKDIIKSFSKEYSETFRKISSGQQKNFIDFSGEGSIGYGFPVESFKGILNEVIDRDGSDAFINQEPLGFLGLRKCINSYFWKSTLNIEDILILSGAQQGIDIVSKALLNINDAVIIDKPTYSGALSVFKARRVNIFEVEIEDGGANIEAMEKLLKKNRIKCYYTMSYFQNPSGISYSHAKKLKILELAEKYDFYIIEDDYLSELIYDENIKYESFKELDKFQRVIYIKSFSKIFLPGIRLGYLISPEIFREQLQNSKINTDISTSSLMQRALELYMERGNWKKYINIIKVKFKNQYEFTEENIRAILKNKVKFNPPGGGLSFYLNISDNSKIDSVELFYKCRDKNVFITPGVLFYKFSSEGKRSFRFGFSQPSNEEILQGLNIISEILEE